MRGPVPWLALAVAGCVALLASARGAGRARETTRPHTAPVTAVAPEARSPEALDPGGVRDVFQYLDQPALESWDAGAMRDPAPATSPEPPPPSVRLLGILWRGERPRAALSIDGELEVLGVGEASSGYVVLEVGADDVRLQTPEGAELRIHLP